MHYIVGRVQGRQTAASALSDLLRIVEVVPVDKADFQQALALGLADFEDAVQAVCALKIGADYIATRNERDFQGSPVKPMAPGALLAML